MSKQVKPMLLLDAYQRFAEQQAEVNSESEKHVTKYDTQAWYKKGTFKHTLWNNFNRESIGFSMFELAKCGTLHNLHGAAVVWIDGQKAYFIDGERIQGELYEDDLIEYLQAVELYKSKKQAKLDTNIE